MSKMYGKRRVVLESKPTRLGNYLMVVCGSKPWTSADGKHSGAGGLHHPLGYWYKIDGLFYVDLKSPEQFYDSVNRDTIACKRLAGLPTKQALREFVMAYYTSNREAK